MLLDEQRKIVKLALEAGRTVLFVGPAATADAASRFADGRVFEVRTVAQWSYRIDPPKRETARMVARKAKEPTRPEGHSPVWWKVVQVRLKADGPPPRIADAPGAVLVPNSDNPRPRK